MKKYIMILLEITDKNKLKFGSQPVLFVYKS